VSSITALTARIEEGFLKYIRWFPGDYLRDTIHLTWDEDCAYRRLLDAYYTTDGNIPSDLEKLYALTRAQTGRQKRAVLRIAQEFFKRKSGKLIQKRARREMKRWRDFRIKCAKAGKRSAAKRLTGNERSTNVATSLVQRTLSPIPTPYETSPNGTFSQDQMLGIPLSLFAEYKRLRESLHRPVLPGAEAHIFAELLELKSAGEDPVEVLTRAVRTSSWKLSPKSKGGNSENEKQRRTKEAIEQAIQGSGRKVAH
jgi:uncharacterized protein YdaU (DUF1376 family)